MTWLIGDANIFINMEISGILAVQNLSRCVRTQGQKPDRSA